MRPKAPTNKMTVLANVLGTMASTLGMFSGKWLCVLCMNQTGPKEPCGKSCPHKWVLPFLGSGLCAELLACSLYLLFALMEAQFIYRLGGFEVNRTSIFSTRRGRRKKKLECFGAIGKTTLLKTLVTRDPSWSLEHATLWDGSGGRCGQWVGRQVRVFITTI